MMLTFLYFVTGDRKYAMIVKVSGSTGERIVANSRTGHVDNRTLLVQEGRLIAERHVLYQIRNAYNPYFGVHLIFTMYQKTQKPVQLPNGRWNCSMDNWKGLYGLQFHLECNLFVQCEDDRDEDHCGYTRCQQEGFQSGGRCYVLGWRANTSHYEANQLCLEKGGHLASFTTRDNITDIKRLLWRTHQYDVKIGLTTPRTLLPWLYGRGLVWMDGTAAHGVMAVNFKPSVFITSSCGGIGKHLTPHLFDSVIVYQYYWESTFLLWDCITQAKKYVLYYLCKLDKPFKQAVKPAWLNVSANSFPPQFILCPSNHTTHSFLVCDSGSVCWGSGDVQFGSDSHNWDIPLTSSCPVPEMTSLPPSYACTSGSGRVPYTLVCDHQRDCSGNTDELLCVFRPCQEIGAQQCGNAKQCYTREQLCDGQPDCLNGEDERSCFVESESDGYLQRPSIDRAVIDFTRNGSTILTIVENGQTPSFQVCPDTHYQCADDGHCLPTFTRCNGLYDCPDHEDESDCDTYTCPGHYRCFHSKICVHPSQVCDGLNHCPRSDDELLCDQLCPEHCVCHGLAFTCQRPVSAHSHPELKYLNGRGSGMTLAELSANTMLIYLSLADCQLTNVSRVVFLNLVSLDLNSNRFVHIPMGMFLGTPILKSLFLSNNPITDFLTINTTSVFPQLKNLDLSRTRLYSLDTHIVYLFSEVYFLNLSNSRLQQVSGGGFQSMHNLHVLDLRGCPMSNIDKHLFRGLDNLHTVYADNYKTCCAAMLLPNLNNCYAPQDELSTCLDLLRSNFYRVTVAIFGCLTLIGNGVSFVFRASSLIGSGSPGFSVFVLHLCVSDFLMGVYLTIVGVADRIYHSVYIWEEAAWRYGISCKLAGFLSLMSCEVSSFLICLVTLDRFLVVRFPLSFLHFKGWNAQLASSLSWIAGFSLAVIPLLPSMSHWEFYSQTGICIPLPVTRKRFAGQSYSFGIMIMLNFLLFQMIATGQAVIYWSIQSNTLSAGSSSQRSQDANIARHLFTVVMSDFLCWFPIGLLGFLASQGVSVSGELNVVMAILVMPLNSALNPFLYTLNLLLAKRRKRAEETLLKLIKSQE